MIYIGIDVAKFKHTAAAIGEDGARLLLGFDFANDEEGFSSLLGKLGSIGAVHGKSSVCIESTGHYGRNLADFLEAHGFDVREVNPILTSNWRRALSVRKVKNDAVDAEALAMWLLAGNPTKRRRSVSEMDDLKSLARSRTFHSQIIGDCKRKAAAITDIVFPEMGRFFAYPFGKAAVAVLERWPGARPLSRARVDSIEKVMREASKGKYGRSDAERLKALAKSSIGQESGPLEFRLRQLLAQMAFTQAQLADLDAELAKLVEGSPITTIPGIGMVCAAGILGEIGDITRFDSASKLVAFAGCDPSVFESGQYTSPHARMSKRGSVYLRWYLWLAADRARMNDPVLADYYAKKRSEGKCHNVALSSVVRKLCAIIFAVLRDNKPYVCPAG